MLMICPKSETKTHCDKCQHKMPHQLQDNCIQTCCNLTDIDVLDCIPAIKLIRKQKLEKIDETIL